MTEGIKAMLGMDLNGRLQRLDEVAALQDGWHDGDGLAPTGVSVAMARDFVTMLLSQPQGTPPGIFPTLVGGIQMEWQNAEIEISPLGVIEVWMDKTEQKT